MPRHGLNRIPYFPQLRRLYSAALSAGPEDNPSLSESAFCEVFSALLFATARDKGYLFVPAKDSVMLAIHLERGRAETEAALQALKALRLLKDSERVTLRKKDPDKLKEALSRGETLPDVYEHTPALALDVNHLQSLLSENGLNLNLRELENAADDKADFFAVITSLRLPLTQGLKGAVTGESFDRLCALAADFACRAMEEEPALCEKAIAPGWHMLLQPHLYEEELSTSVAEGICLRWSAEGQRAIDLEFSDASLFIVDSVRYKGTVHYVRHVKHAEESETLCAALLLYLAKHEPALSYFGELPEKIISRARQLCDRLDAMSA